MRILITGGAGYIGCHTVRRLAAHGHDLTVFDNLSTGHAESVPPGVLVRGDLLDADQVRAVLRNRKVDAVVHFAASAYVGESVRDPALYYRNNVFATINLLDGMRAAGVRKLVFSSTVATFGIPPALPITEDMPQRPINPYGQSKLAMEGALRDYSRAYGLGYVTLRFFNAAGASPDGDLGEDHDPEPHLIPLVIRAAMGLRPHIEVYGTDYDTPDGTCIRDYVHVEDLATAHVLALDKVTDGAGLAYHLGSERGASIREVIATVEAVTGLKVPVTYGPRREGDPPALVASSELARRELGWRPAYTDLRAIVETAWNWHRSHPRGYAT